MKKLGGYVWLFIKIAIGVFLLVFSLSGISWQGVISVFGLIDMRWFILTVISILIGLSLKIVRWAVLLRNYEVRVAPRNIAGALFLGQAVNILLPIRGGEVARIGVIGIGAPESIVQIGITIGLEKLLDLITFLSLALVSFHYVPFINENRLTGSFIPLALGGLVILIFVVLFGFNFWPRIKSKIEGVSSPNWKWALQFVHRLITTSLWLRDLRRVWLIIFLTILIWVTMWSTNLFLLLSVRLPANLLAGVLVLVFGFLQVLPINMPGNVGTAYFFTKLSLQPFGYPIDTIAAYAILLHALITLPPMLFSAMYLLLIGSDYRLVLNSTMRWRRKLLSSLYSKNL